MIQNVVNKRDLHDFSSIKEDLIDWLGKTSEERVAAVDYLRNPYQHTFEEGAKDSCRIRIFLSKKSSEERSKAIWRGSVI